MENSKGERLTQKEIRTHYSGIILFAAKLTTVATGIIYALMVANSLPQAEYGVWGIFNIIIPYFTILSGAISFWAMRFVARGMQGATKTGAAANTAIGTMAALIYLALLPIITPRFGLQNYLTVYFVMATQVVELYVINVLESCLQGKQPELVGYGLLVGEILKVALSYVFIIHLQLGLIGVAFALVVASAIKIVFYIKTVFGELKQKIAFNYIREWMKGSAFNVYNIIGDRMAAIIFLLLTIYGTEIAASYYYASVQIANVIVYSTFIAFALTPKLLAEGKIDEATMSLKLVMMFAIPMTAGVLALPDSYLVFLRTTGEYVIATPVLVILAIDALVLTTSSIFHYVLYGIERVDEKAKIPFREVVRSRVFIAFSLPYVHSAITLPTAFYALTFLAHNDPLQVAIYVTGINTVGHVATFLVLYYVLRKAVRVKIPWSNIGKYAASSAIMGFMLFFLHPTRRLPTLIFTAIGGLVYIVIVLAIDSDTRKLARISIKILKTRIRL